MRATLSLFKKLKTNQKPPYEKNQTGLFYGKSVGYGNKVSEKGHKTRRSWFPNWKLSRIWSETFKRFLKIECTASALRTIDKKGGLDRFLLTTKDDLLGARGIELRGYLEKRLRHIQKVRYPEFHIYIQRPAKVKTTTFFDGKDYYTKPLDKEVIEPKLSLFGNLKIIEEEGKPQDTLKTPFVTFNAGKVPQPGHRKIMYYPKGSENIEKKSKPSTYPVNKSWYKELKSTPGLNDKIEPTTKNNLIGDKTAEEKERITSDNGINDKIPKENTKKKENVLNPDFFKF
ncbi:hypothetical protein G9A89_020773 [Geosiphon pyriformis]|nr:hypothetical protein G9A89_020773 [Geosiphon pyriformis]